MSKVIRISDRTYRDLIRRGTYGETMDDIIRDLLRRAPMERKRTV